MITHPASTIARWFGTICVTCALLCAAPLQAQTADESGDQQRASMAATENGLSCANASFRKHIALTDVLIAEPPADIQNLGHAMASRLVSQLKAHLPIDIVRLPATRNTSATPAVDAFGSVGTPYFVRLSANGLALKGQVSRFELWKTSYEPRGGHIDVSAIDGSTGRVLTHFSVAADPVSEGQYTPTVNAESSAFWESDYGASWSDALQNVAKRLSKTIGCQPAVGVVTAVSGDQLTINLGQDDGLQKGASLLLIQRGQPDVRLGNPMPLTNNDRALGFAKLKSLGANSSRLVWSGKRSASVGDLVWTGERPGPNP